MGRHTRALLSRARAARLVGADDLDGILPVAAFELGLITVSTVGSAARSGGRSDLATWMSLMVKGLTLEHASSAATPEIRRSSD